MNLANKITTARLGLVPVFILSMYLFPENNILSLTIFVVASLTDFLDGYVARKYNMVTTLGKFLDPLVDKILVITAFVLMAERNVMPGWIVAVIIGRELIITGLRTIAADKGVTIAASYLGKIKTTTQMLAIIIYFLSISISSLVPIYRVMVYVCAIATIISGLDYIFKNKNVLKG